MNYTVIFKKVITLLLTLASGSVFLYGQMTVTGKVTDAETAEALIGVNVVLQGTTSGTITDVDGNYTIVVQDQNSVLRFSYVGYHEKDLMVGNQTRLDVTMQTSVQALDEIVVIGYGTQKKIDLSGAVSVVKSDDLETIPIVSAGEALKGRAAGVYVKSNSGQPGSDPSLLIRGRSSISAGNSPLIVVDGVPGVPMGSVDFNDVLSFSVLKDAASAAIYGSAGANGVILITTRRGEAGKTRVNANYSATWIFPPEKLGVLNSEQSLDLIRELGRETDISSMLGDQYRSALDPLGGMIDTNNLVHNDWQDEIFRVAMRHNASLAFAGGQEKFAYNVSAGYLSEEGYLKPTEYQRFTFRSNLDYKLSDKLSMMTDLAVTRTSRRTVTEGEFAWNGATILTALNTYELIPKYDERNGGYFVNPFQPNVDIPPANINGSYGRGYNTRLVAKYGLVYEFLPGLSYRFDLMSQISLSKSSSYRSRYHTDVGRQASGSASSSTSEGFGWDMNHFLSYQKSLGQHNLEALAGFVTESSHSYSMSASRRGYPTDTIPHVYVEYRNFPGLTVGYTAGSGRSDYLKLSYVGRLTYNYNSRYFFQLNFRADGSSRFGPENRWGVFPSGSLAWRFSEENFMEPLAFLSNGKLRLTYGKTGNDAFGSYLYASFWSATGHGMWNNDDLAAGFSPNTGRAPNPYLQWEESVEQNLGLDLGLWNNRITTTIDIYNKDSYNLLYNADLPPHTGYTAGYLNLGRVNVKGLDFQLTTFNISKSNFSWSTTLTLSADRNKVADLGGLDDQFSGEQNIVRVGYPIDSHYGYVMEGVFPDQESVDSRNVTLPDGTIQPYQYIGTSAGDVIFKNMNGFQTDSVGNILLDINGNPYKIITSDDRVIIGNPNPDFYFGFENTFTYKNWNLSVFFQGTYGNDIYSLTRREIERMDHFFNYSSVVLDRWRNPGDITNVPRATVVDPNANSDTPSTRFIEDGSFVRLKYITLSYRIPQRAMSRLGMSSAHVYVTGENLLTITNYSMYDPEIATNGSQGIDMGGVPQARLFVAGVRLNF